MKKLSINIQEGLGDVLSQEELKHVLGGMGSYGSSDSEEFGSMSDTDCNASDVPPQVLACRGKKLHQECSYVKKNGELFEGTCQLWVGKFFCASFHRTPCRK